MKRVSCSAVGRRLVGNNDDASRLVALGGVRVQTFRRVAFGRGYRARPVDMRELVDTTGDARSPVDALAGAPWASTRDSRSAPWRSQPCSPRSPRRRRRR